MGERFVACFVAAAGDAGLPADPQFRALLRAYTEDAVAEVLAHGRFGEPAPDGNRDVAAALGRPVALAVPYPVLRPVLGGLRVLPARLTAAGFGFRHPDVDTAIRAALADG